MRDDGAAIKKLIDHVFPALDQNMDNPHYMTSRAILSTRNDMLHCPEPPRKVISRSSQSRTMGRTRPRIQRKEKELTP
jgi:hypothetical protein